MLYDHVANADSDAASLPERVRLAIARFHRGCPVTRQLEMTRRFFEEYQTQKKVVGFKTKVSDVFHLHAMKHVLEQCEVRAIVMERRNLVKQVVSRMNAKRLHVITKEWNLLDADSKLGPFEVDLKEFDRTLQQAAFDQTVLSAFADYLDVPKLRLEYADLLRDRNAWFADIFKFLDVEPRNLDSAVLKNTDDRLRSVVTNFDKMKAAYAGSKFEPMFDS